MSYDQAIKSNLTNGTVSITSGNTASGIVSPLHGSNVSFQVNQTGTAPFFTTYQIRTSNDRGRPTSRGGEHWFVETENVPTTFSGAGAGSNTVIVHISNVCTADIGLWVTCGAGSGTVEILSTVKI